MRLHTLGVAALVADFVGSSNVLPPDVTERLDGRRAWASLRPEAIRLVSEGGVEAMVTGHSYLGAATKLGVFLGEQRLTVLLPAGSPVPAQGQMVSIQWNPADLHVMEDERDMTRMKMALRLFYDVFRSAAVREVTTEAFPAAFSARVRRLNMETRANWWKSFAGSFLMGVLVVALAELGGNRFAPLLMTGVLGGFTTFSAFSLDAATLYERGQVGPAAAYILASVILSVMALFAGLWFARSLTT